MSPANLLEVSDLRIFFPSDHGGVTALQGISFCLRKGETLGIVGESGSGKSMTALSIIGLLPPNARKDGGRVRFQTKDGSVVDLAHLTLPEFQALRGSEIGMIFQEPMTSLNPVFRCGEQVAEALRLHRKLDSKAAQQAVLSLFEKVKLPDPMRIYRSYPHELSGGQRQRVMIAMALSCNPTLLVADEPTSALDVTVQQSFLQLLKELKSSWEGSTIFISHDLGVVAQVADRVLVMEKGVIVEEGKVEDIFHRPVHPYTQHLLKNFRNRSASVAAVKAVPERLPKELLSVRSLCTWFPGSRGFLGKKHDPIKAVDDVSFQVFEGETLGLVGESGSGKTTLGRSILHLLTPSSGEVWYKGTPLSQLPKKEWKPLRKEMQLIFQDPNSSLNPQMPIGLALTEPMKVHGLFDQESQRRQRAVELLEMVGMDASHFWRYPNEFSGGQRQRICIARALALEPKFIVCDECLSSLDVTVQAQLLDLLKDLQRKKGLTYLFISHDLSVVKMISDRVAVMKDGKIVEMRPTFDVFSNPESDYTVQLLQAIPKVF